jgi:hypothetical protein
MELIQLNKDQVASLYNERMVHDFKKDELKPLKMILKALDEGIYECLGLSDGAGLLGYTFLVRQGKRYLVDYLAVYPEERDKGRGATILKLLSEYITDAEIVVVEVEDPFYAESSEEKEIQERRVSFYLRNNCVDTGVRVRCFGVPFIIIRSGGNSSLDRDVVWEIYQSFYRAVLPKKMFDANIELISNADLGE